MGWVTIRYADGTVIHLGDHPDQKPGWQEHPDMYSIPSGATPPPVTDEE